MAKKITVYYDFDDCYSVLLCDKPYMHNEGEMLISRELYRRFNKAERQYWKLADKITMMIKNQERKEGQ